MVLMKRILFFSIFLSIVHGINAQSVGVLSFKDSIEVRLIENRKFLFHKTLPKQTLFSISNFYGVSVDDIFALNPDIKEKGLTIGQMVKIDLPEKAIIKSRKKGFYRWKHAPIVYEVVSGDNLFKISKEYFEEPMDSVLSFSKKKDKTIHDGEKLVIGWLDVKGIPDSLHVKVKPNKSVAVLKDKEQTAKEIFDKQITKESVKKIVEQKSAIAKTVNSKKDTLKKETAKQNIPKKDTVVVIPVVEYVEYQTQGVASWSKSNYQNNDLYVLHRKAPINSYIEINNPMKRKTTYAKVIDRIPDGTNTDVEVVLSPATAKMLGARDPKFFVKIKYKIKK